MGRGIKLCCCWMVITPGAGAWVQVGGLFSHLEVNKKGINALKVRVFH